MTDTVPAADTGLPADQHPDAKLLELRALLVASDARGASYVARLAEVAEFYEPPPIPATLHYRPSDRPHVCAQPGALERCWTARGWQPFYADLEEFTPRARRFLAAGEAYQDDLFSAQARARMREIRAAHASWCAEIREAENAAGVLEPGEALEREDPISAGLVREIGATPARTLEGLAAKARTLLGRRHFAGAPLAVEEPAFLSILHDVERLGAGETSISKRSPA